MNSKGMLDLILIAGLLTARPAPTPALEQSATGDFGLNVPGFHHLHLNSIDPAGALSFYTQQFPSTKPGAFAGLPAVQTDKYYVVFNKVSSAPPVEPPTAFWHFGWHVTSSHQNYEAYKQRTSVRLLPLYRSEEGETVYVNTDSWPGMLTQAQIADAKAKGVSPNPVGGWAYLRGPDNVIVEYHGDFPRERFNHVHSWQEDPFCAERWYQRHLLAAESPSWPMHGGVPRPGASADCKVPRGEPSWPSLDRRGTIRVPPGGVSFDDVELNFYPNQANQPLVSSRGHAIDHVALSVANLDRWFAKLKGEGVKILEQPQTLGDTRAFMIEGPSREVIELVEVRR